MWVPRGPQAARLPSCSHGTSTQVSLLKGPSRGGGAAPRPGGSTQGRCPAQRQGKRPRGGPSPLLGTTVTPGGSRPGHLQAPSHGSAAARGEGGRNRRAGLHTAPERAEPAPAPCLPQRAVHPRCRVEDGRLWDTGTCPARLPQGLPCSLASPRAPAAWAALAQAPTGTQRRLLADAPGRARRRGGLTGWGGRGHSHSLATASLWAVDTSAAGHHLQAERCSWAVRALPPRPWGDRTRSLPVP